MTNEEILQSTLSATIERLSKQTKMYEAEIANLNAQIIMLTNQVSELSNIEKVEVVEDDN